MGKDYDLPLFGSKWEELRNDKFEIFKQFSNNGN